MGYEHTKSTAAKVKECLGRNCPEGSRQSIARTMSDAMVDSIHDLGDVRDARGEALVDTVKGAVYGSAEIGASVGESAKGAVIGVLRGTGDVGQEAIRTVVKTTHALVHATSEVGGRLGRRGQRRC